MKSMKQRFSQHMRYYERSLILILMLFSASVMQAQNRTVKGTVSDAQGEPIIGANVVIVGGTKGVITDLDGKYSIQVPENGAVLKFSYIGFKKKAIYYERDARVAGSTKWNYWNLINLAIKGLTSFSRTPLRIVSFIGLTVSIIAFIYLVTVVIRAMIWGDPVTGYPSLVSVILFLGGVQLLALGIIGEYLGIIFSETKKRPIYYINEYCGNNEKKS